MGALMRDVQWRDMTVHEQFVPAKLQADAWRAMPSRFRFADLEASLARAAASHGLEEILLFVDRIADRMLQRGRKAGAFKYIEGWWVRSDD